MADPIDTPAENAVPADANLTIQDLSTVLQLIQVVQSRGAIKAEEMATVGALFTKLQTFLDAAGKAAEAAEQAAPVPAAPAALSDGTDETAGNAEIIGTDEK